MVDMEATTKKFIDRLMQEIKDSQKSIAKLEDANHQLDIRNATVEERNEDLIHLVRQLDLKMNQLEQFIISEVPNGEERLMKIINEDDPEQMLYQDVPISQGQSSMNCRTYQALFEKSVSRHQPKTQAHNSVERLKIKHTAKPPKAMPNVESEFRLGNPVRGFGTDSKPRATRNHALRQSKSEKPAEAKPMEYLNPIIVEK